MLVMFLIAIVPFAGLHIPRTRCANVGVPTPGSYWIGAARRQSSHAQPIHSGKRGCAPLAIGTQDRSVNKVDADVVVAEGVGPAYMRPAKVVG